MFNQDQNDADPLGIGLQARAGMRRLADRANLMESSTPTEWNMRPIQNVLPFPQWDGFFQALHENGVNRLAGGPSPSTNIEGMTPSNALMGLRQLTGYAGAGETQPGLQNPGPYQSNTTDTTIAANKARRAYESGKQ